MLISEKHTALDPGNKGILSNEVHCMPMYASPNMISRFIAAGSVKRLSFDDYVMTATFIIYTSLLILIQISSQHGTNLFPPEDTQRILADPQQVKDRIYGSKIVIGLEQCMLFSTWGVKICMLTLFWRLTANIRFLHLYVKAIAVYVAVGFVVIMVAYYGIYCRPFEQYWQLPVENMQCATYQHYSITQAVFNISSDAAMLVVPIPLLMKTQLKVRRKFILVCIMSLGVFTIVAAILNKVYNFASPLTTTYQIWYIREASTAIYVANLICLWPLLRKLFGLKAFQANSKHYRQHGAHLMKESPGASQSPGTTISSQSRPSFSVPRIYLSRLGSGKTVKNVGPQGADEVLPSREAANKLSVSRLDTMEVTYQEKQGLGEPGPTLGETHRSHDLEVGDIRHIDYHSSLKFG
ncbi:hypothetical protein BDV27DRAFT_143823 [Aspergillus caelatus]|uniref:Rhodopsin domain-containing protein n=1 Tax=Aspergillus caelatus TaxID=61420 RepID=A0A5N7A8M3_9EURO|nr:uncharacterized protein BDV27DRAFT_143823 [Aspergillus caelatus]KAE8366204.1 hypothetical protein BDV27DRAFT_143823 [Aspergillus caelatus]